MKQKFKNTKGITLVALIITIIVLLILAVVAITSIGNSNIIKHAQNGKDTYEQAKNNEAQILAGYEKFLSGKQNSKIQDKYGNEIIIPEGFEIYADSKTGYTKNNLDVTKGIVIQDKEGNQFVWIPVGTIYTSEDHSQKTEITLGRYTDFTHGAYQYSTSSEIIENSFGRKYQEEKSSANGNAVAINIDDFKEKTTQSKGFYIGRYEARTTNKRNQQTNELPKMTLKPNDYVYDYVTQPQASKIAREMYSNSQAYTCDLVNSYAWDTATVFFQEFGGNERYAYTHVGVDMSSCDKGTSASDYAYEDYIDKICNVYDMSCNRFEWTTETSVDDSTKPCTVRAGSADTYSPKDRLGRTNAIGTASYSFRPILYVSPVSGDAEVPEAVIEEIYKDISGNNVFTLSSDGSGNISQSVYFTYNENNIMTFEEGETSYSGTFEKSNVNGQDVIIFHINFNNSIQMNLITVKDNNWNNFKGLDGTNFTGAEGIVAKFADGKMTVTQNGSQYGSLKDVDYAYLNGVLCCANSDYFFTVNYDEKTIEIISME